MRNGTVPLGAPKLNKLALGGGGFVTCIDASPSNGRLIIGCDTSPPQWREAGSAALKWVDCFNGANTAGLNVGAEIASAGGYKGAWGVAISASNPDVMMVATQGALYRTTNAWATMSKCNLAAFPSNPNNGLNRTWNPRLAIHPTDPLTFILGTENGGVKVSTNGGTICSDAGIAAGTLWGGASTSHLVCFDPTAPANVYATRFGSGVYRSTTGVGGPWTLIGSGPVHPGALHVAHDGTVYCADVGPSYGSGDASTGLWKLARGSSTWAMTATQPSGGCTTITSDPSNSGHLYVGNADSSNQSFSLDAGVTWTHCDTATIDATVNGLTWLEAGSFFASQLFVSAYDSKLYQVQGRGIVRMTLPTTSTWAWEEFSLGNEMIGVLGFYSQPGIQTISRAYDKTMGRPYNLRSADYRPITPGFAVDSGAVTHCFSIDCEPGNPQHLVSLCDFGAYYNGYNDNGGAGFWPLFATPAHPDSSHRQMSFSALSGSFVNGAVVTGGTSGAHGTLLFTYKYGNVSTQTAGVIMMSNVSGTFVVGETITGVGGGSATVAPNGDGGADFTPAPYGGVTCRTGPTQMIWCPANEGRAVRTTDFGATWIDLSIGGVSPVMAQNNSRWLNRQNFASDKAQAGHVAFIGRNEDNPTPHLPLCGVFFSSDHGATWVKKFDGFIDPSDNQQFYYAQLQYVPGHAGKLLYTGGVANCKLWNSDDDGATWTRLGAACNLLCYNYYFGKNPVAGSSWPAIILFATVNGVDGLYISYDYLATTPTLITANDGSLNFWGYSAFGGDMNVAGRVWCALQQGGYGYIDFKDVRALT